MIGPASCSLRARIMNNREDGNRTRPREKKELKKKIHRALLEARNALHRGEETKAREIVRQVMAEAAPLAYRASLEGGFNWVVEELKPLDELMLPGEDQ